MKKIILSVAAVMAFGLLQAQEIKFGLKAGANFATLTGEDAENTSVKTGLHVGGVVEFKFTENFSLQPELIYSMQGTKAEMEGVISGVPFTADLTAKLDYLNIPVLAKYYVAKGFSLEAGPQVGFLLNAKEEGDVTAFINGSSVVITEEVDAKEAYKTLDFGFNIGAAYDLPAGFFFQARYYAGLSEIGDSYEADGTQYEAAAIKNSVIQLSLGYKF